MVHSTETTGSGGSQGIVVDLSDILWWKLPNTWAWVLKLEHLNSDGRIPDMIGVMWRMKHLNLWAIRNGFYILQFGEQHTEFGWIGEGKEYPKLLESAESTRAEVSFNSLHIRVCRDQLLKVAFQFFKQVMTTYFTHTNFLWDCFKYFQYFYFIHEFRQIVNSRLHRFSELGNFKIKRLKCVCLYSNVFILFHTPIASTD